MDWLKNELEWVTKRSDPSWLRIGVALAIILTCFTWRPAKGGPPGLWDPVPRVFNTAQYILDNKGFTFRMREILKHNSIAKFNLLMTPVFLVRGQRNVQAMFTNPHKLGLEYLFENYFFPSMYAMPAADRAQFARDKSGTARLPAPGYEHLGSEERIWYGYESLFIEYLGRSGPRLFSITEHFLQCFADKLRRNYVAGESTTISLVSFCRNVVAESYTEALFGPRIFELNPGLMDAFWDLDSQIPILVLSIPRWLYPKPYRMQERFFGMVRKWIEDGLGDFDWDSPAATADWEPRFGARFNREVLSWSRKKGFSRQFAVGSQSMFVFG